MVRSDSKEQLRRGAGRAHLWGEVPQIHCIFNSKGPKIERNFTRTVNHCMDHHGTSASRDGLNGAFCDAVLMMSSNSRKLDRLT